MAGGEAVADRPQPKRTCQAPSSDCSKRPGATLVSASHTLRDTPPASTSHTRANTSKYGALARSHNSTDTCPIASSVSLQQPGRCR